MRTALIVVKSPLAAQSIGMSASQLGVTGIRTAATAAEAVRRLEECPAELILADTAVTRPDTLGFTKRVKEVSPQAVLVLLGPEEPAIAAAAVAAGARGLIRGTDHDLVATVTKTLLLIGTPRRAPGPAPAANGATTGRSGSAREHNGSGAARQVAASAATARTGAQAAAAGTVLVPSQRQDAVGPGARRLTLTERELQVLKGMAEGKSNAEIGRELFVSEDTVKTHARRLFRKLRARDRAHAVAVGFRSGALG